MPHLNQDSRALTYSCSLETSPSQGSVCRQSPALGPPRPELTLHHSLFYLNLAMCCYKSLLWFRAPLSPAASSVLSSPPPAAFGACHSLSPPGLFIPAPTNPSTSFRFPFHFSCLPAPRFLFLLWLLSVLGVSPLTMPFLSLFRQLAMTSSSCS